jgi:type IV secretory pathway VirB10-like protein
MKTTVSSFSRFGLLALIVALGSGAAVAQSIWKWRDKDGHIQVSDRPPPVEIPDKDILQRPHSARAPMPPPAASEAATDAPPPGGDPTLEAKKTKAQAEQAAQEKAKKDAETAKRNQAKAETCQRARNQLAALESGQRIGRMNEKGEREILDDKGREAEIARSRQIADSACN